MEQKELWFTPRKETASTYAPTWKIQLWKFVQKYLFHTSIPQLSCWRVFLLRCFGAEIGEKCYIAPSVTISQPWLFHMGNKSALDEYTYIQPPVTIGSYVSISNNVKIIADGHDVRSRVFTWIAKPIIINNGCFVGADTYINSGITIGQFSVIGAHSFVLKNVPDNSIAFGNPCIVHSERIPCDIYQQYVYE